MKGLPICLLTLSFYVIVIGIELHMVDECITIGLLKQLLDIVKIFITEQILLRQSRKGKGISCLGTLFHALTWMDNKVALARLQAGVSVALDQHLKVYPKDYDLVLSESNINPKFLQLSR